ncbi:uncharacterized protein LOC122064440 isoform X2 [Macadamia integrifolia]|uniref:uncharacterized protein LOC122064440 isoform X2 n=1 Tax=Macadamia integrifolia TaxID=60698 RepID=UPI001C4EF422|nr:uncharacterized protein LOC122064440 isoform X2 [Macadamia integrifolia]
MCHCAPTISKMAFLPRINMPRTFPSYAADTASGFSLSRHRSLFSNPYLKPTFHSPCHLHLSFPGCTAQPYTFCCRRYATNPDYPPPEPEPPFDNDLTSTAGLDATFSRFQDRVQIFLAVLFWMSLFFWACAWGERNDGRPSKGSRFRR